MRSNLVLGFIDVDNEAGAAGDPNKEATSIHVNFMYNPVKNLRLGIEYLYAERELESGLDGELNRVQFSSQYTF
jgi:hypothetical protein